MRPQRRAGSTENLSGAPTVEAGFVLNPAIAHFSLYLLPTRSPNAKAHPAMSTAALRRFVRDDSGIAVTEYGLLIALVAVLLIGVVTIFGSSIASWFAAKTNLITSF